MDTATKPDIIARLSMLFVKNWRISILLSIGILAIGIASYTTFLKREGFPTIEVPIALVQTPYFVQDQNKVNQDITQPLEEVLSNIPEVSQISSTTSGTFSSIVVEFKGDTTSQEGVDIIEQELTRLTLPNDTKPNLVTINAAAFDGENDLLFSVIANSDTTTPSQLQSKAESIAQELESVSGVTRSTVIPLIEEQINPITGESVTKTVAFARSAYQKDENLTFSDAILIGAVRESDIGTIDFSTAIQDKIQTLKDNGELEGFDVVFGGGDASGALQRQLSVLESSAVSGLLFVMIVMLLIVNWRSSLIIAIFIPLCITLTLTGLYLIGYSLNTLTLFGLILVIGLIADDAILVIDAIDSARKEGHKGKEAVIFAINRVGLADISGTVTTILAFAPLAAVSGTLGEFIRLIPITVILTLTLSLIIGLTLVPFFANYILPNYTEAKESKPRRGISRLWYGILYLVPHYIDWLNRQVYRFIHSYLNHVWSSILVFLVAIGLIGSSFSLASKLQFAIFAPAKDTNEITITIESTTNATIEDTLTDTKQVETIIQDTQAQYIDDITYINANERGVLMYITLSQIGTRDKTSRAISEELQKSIDDTESLQDSKIKVAQAGAGPPSDDYQVTLQIFSNDQTTLEQATQEVRDFISSATLENGEITDVIVTNIDSISKKDGRRFGAVKIALSDPDDTAMVLAAQTLVQDKFVTDEFRDKYSLDKDGIAFDLGQQGENLDSFQSAVFALIVAVIVMYVLLVLQFNSFTQPILILTAVPFAFPGLFLGLYLTNNPLSFFAMIGITGLVGIVVNNTILLLDYANVIRKETGSIREAISEAVRYRFRALITTSLSTIIGILPLAFADPFWEGLAYALVFGLASSTLMVIFAYPVFYAILEHIRRFGWRVIFRQKQYK